jgi:hypothetical protein
MKYLKGRKGFLQSDKKNLVKINEEAESGPFENDIPWNDSLLGRLINSTIRKAKIGANLIRIEAVNKRLRDCFEELLAKSAMGSLSNEDKKEYNGLVIFSFLEALKKSVEDGESINIIKNLTDSSIKDIQSLVDNRDNVDELPFDKDELIKLIEQLKEFRKFLEGVETNEGDESQQDSETEEDSSQVAEEFYKNSITMLKSIVTLSTKLSVKPKNSEEVTGSKTKVGKQELVTSESLLILESDDASNAWNKVIKAYNTSGILKYISKIQELIKGSESGNEGQKKTISTIGKQVILNEKTIGQSQISYDSLIKEDLFINDIPKSISLLSNVLLAFKNNLGLASKIQGQGATPTLPGESIISFNKSYSKLKELFPKLKSSEVRTESLIKKYSNFILIKESEETKNTKSESSSDEESTVTEPIKMTTSQKIKDYWDKKVDIKKFVLTRSQAEKIRLNFDKASKADSITINGLDPIIEIVKVFNRAYKLHTTQVIPTGRSGGKVSNKTFREYTAFGDGRPETAGASGGPYRNNAIFNSWENAVQDIMKDTKYQKIFRQETTLKTESGKIIKDAGKNLLRFMNDMLDGETLYKSGGANGMGKQAEFIQKYFDPEAKIEPTKLTIGGADESKEITQNSNAIKEHNVSFTDKPIAFKEYSELAGTFFATNGTFNKTEGQTYFWIQSVDSEFAYVVYCRSLYYFREYIKSTGITFKNGITKGSLPLNIVFDKQLENKDYILQGAKIKLTNLFGDMRGIYKLIGDFKVKSINRYDGKINNANKESQFTEKEDTINVEKVYTMCEIVKNEEDKEILKRFKLTKNPIEKVRTLGGITDAKTSKGISQTYFKQ